MKVKVKVKVKVCVCMRVYVCVCVCGEREADGCMHDLHVVSVPTLNVDFPWICSRPVFAMINSQGSSVQEGKTRAQWL